eukprot:scaffold4201_cov119-Isochrysis_galbana.AAC.9
MPCLPRRVGIGTLDVVSQRHLGEERLRRRGGGEQVAALPAAPLHIPFLIPPVPLARQPRAPSLPVAAGHVVRGGGAESGRCAVRRAMQRPRAEHRLGVDRFRHSRHGCGRRFTLRQGSGRLFAEGAARSRFRVWLLGRRGRLRRDENRVAVGALDWLRSLDPANRGPQSDELRPELSIVCFDRLQPA